MNGHVRRREYRDSAGRLKRTAWQARYADPVDRRKRVEKTFATKKEAERWLVGQQASVGAGLHTDPRRTERPFTELVDAWRASRWPSLAMKSKARYEQVLRKHLLPEFGGRKVGAVDREAVRVYFGRLGARVEKGEIAAGTVLKVHTTLSSIMSEGVELGMVPVNPCTRVRGLPSAQPRKMQFLTAGEVRILADAIPEYRVLVLTAAYTGLRAGELHALRRRDVDLDAGVLRVRGALKGWQGGEPVFGTTKSGKARAVTLPAFLTELLREHLRSIPGGIAPDAFVFTNGNGGPIHQVAWLRNHFKPAREKALPDHPGLRFHDLRHTAASLLIAADAHPKAIQERLGHASITTTLDRYGHLMPGLDAALMGGLDAAYAVGAAPASLA